jgi:glycosyltransferase involved in cell wall biosynthesis
MKILQVCQSFYPCFASGGVTRVVYEVSKELVSLGHEVTVYTTDGCAEVIANNKQSKNIEGVNVYYFKNLFKKLKSKFKITNPYYIPIIARTKIKKFDIIHIHEHRTILAVIVYHYAKKNNVPYIVQAHGSVMPFYQKTWLKKLFDNLWGNNILKNASKVIALTETELKQYKKMGVLEDKIEIIPNGINLSNYQNLPEKGEFKKKYGIDKDERIILYLGRIHKNKGIDLIIKAFPNLLKNYKNVKLVVVGPDGGFLKSLIKLTNTLNLEDKVLFTGPLYENEKDEVYIDANIFVTPNYSGFPLTFLESCIYGLPIITTNKGDELNWIDNNVGYVVGYNEYELAQAMINILSDDDLKNKFGLNGNNLVRTKFNWQIISKYIEKIYIEVL